MRYVILRDDDTNALTPVECLEMLYRPFLERGLPVNLAVIPDVRLDAIRPDGLPEQFLFARNGTTELTKPIGDNERLVCFLRENSGLHIAQHGYDHSLFEFDSASTDDIRDRLEQGTRLLMDAGFPRPQTFVAPYDKLSSVSLCEAARRFRIISTGWFEWRRVPRRWWPRYALRKFTRQPHWRIGETLLLTHPGCLLSYQRSPDTILEALKQSITSRRLTVLVTHWWEYFPGGKRDKAFIRVLHETADWLANEPDLRVISFDDLARGDVPVN